jgi:murein DD-endopeptidase MepM/ murein hydrolase activator NlpD
LKKLAAALLALAAGLGFIALRQAGHFGGVPTAPAFVVAGPPVVTVRDTLHARETLSQLFERRNVRGVDWGAVEQAVRNFDPARVRAGMVFTFRQRHGEDVPLAVMARVSNESRLHLDRTGAVWAARIENIPWRIEQVRATGVITSNLYEAMDAAVGDDVLPVAARRDLVWGLSDVYQWAVDFAREVQEGDRFEVLAERLVSSEGEVRFGRVLAARLDLGGRAQYAFRFDDGDRPEFFDQTAHSMKRDYLRSPVEFKRISSRFSRRRYQPILHVFRAHQGTDFAAAIGTPVRAVSDGTVKFAGRDAGYGNLIALQHKNGVETRYAHLLGFADAVHSGVRVQQGQTIGYVGSSGLSTGPHLHYEVRVAGQAVDPRRSLGVGTGAPIASPRRAAFEAERQHLMQLLEPGAVPASPHAD